MCQSHPCNSKREPGPAHDADEQGGELNELAYRSSVGLLIQIEDCGVVVSRLRRLSFRAPPLTASSS
jgi:hypothetical protein